MNWVYFGEMMIADTSKNHTKRLNSLCGQTVRLLNEKLVIQTNEWKAGDINKKYALRDKQFNFYITENSLPLYYKYHGFNAV
jgi:hypothetical protein